MPLVGQFDQVLPGSTRFDQVRPHPAVFELIICNPPLISTPVWKVKQQHVSIMHFTSLRCQSEQLHPIWIFHVCLTYSSLRWRAGSNHLAIIPQPLTFVGLPKWLVDPIVAPKGVEHGWTATTCVLCVPVYWVFTEHFSVYIDVYIRVVNVCPIFASWVVSSDSQLIINAALLISDANASCLMTE